MKRITQHGHEFCHYKCSSTGWMTNCPRGEEGGIVGLPLSTVKKLLQMEFQITKFNYKSNGKS